MISTLGFFLWLFVVFGGLFVIFSVWIFGFQSTQTLAYAGVSMSGL